MKVQRLLPACTLAMLFLPMARAEIVLSELMYRPASTNVLEEWLELHNPGPGLLDVSGWRFTQGIGFQFPPLTSIPAGGYLVVAADAATFQAQHPAVANFVAGWSRTLGDDGDVVTLEDTTGTARVSLLYGPQGDWAVRRLGAADKYGRQGWEWFALHDGGGRSAELINPALPNGNGLNWAASTVEGGTPGRANSVASTNIAPIFAEVRHFPLVPTSTEGVRISVRVLDERGAAGLTVTLHHRLDGAATFSETPMFDDGAHGDGLAGDGLFAVALPPHADKTIVEFYLLAEDADGLQRFYPEVVPSGSARTANFLYQVSDEAQVGSQPRYRLILAKAEYDYLKGIWSGASDSNAQVNGTLIATDGVLDGGTTTQLRYLAAFRNRGHGSRSSVPHNIRVDVPKDRPWQDRTGLNLNTQYTAAQLFGSDLMRRAGLPMAESRTVQVRVNGEDLAGAGAIQLGTYVANESPNGSFVKRQFPGDASGNYYRGIRDVIPGAKADLAWHGPLATSYTNAYFKENNVNAGHWGDLVHMLDVLNNTPDADYASRVPEAIDVRQWMRYFAINTLLGNQETCLATGFGDDYALFAGVNDTRFLLLPYDMDSILGKGTRTTTYADGLFKMVGTGSTAIPTLDRLMKHPAFAPVYYQQLLELADTLFIPAVMDPLIDQLRLSFTASAAVETSLASMKAFNVSHQAHVRSLIPVALTVTNDLAVVSGYARATTATVSLRGTSHAARTRRVLVNGIPATWSAWQATWTAPGVDLRPGINRILILALGEGDAEVDRAVSEVWFDDGSVASAGATVSANTTWSAAGGPYQINSSLTIASGATLTIEPGTTVYLGSGVNLAVASGGRLVAEGTAAAPIHFTRAPGTASRWGGIVVNGGAGTPETRIAHAHIAFNGTTAIHSTGGTVWLDHLTFGSADQQYVSLDASSFVVAHCVFPSATAGFEPCHGTGGIKTGGHGLFYRNYFGHTQGYNDVIDFTGGNRPSPIVQFIGNVFTGSGDDMLDLDGTDAWVEGNIFLHGHRNGSPDSSSAVSGGSDGGRTSHVTIVGNVFYDVDQAATAKQGNFYVLLNNTVVRQNHAGSQDTFTAILNFGDDGTTEGAGMYVEGNIFHDAEALTRNRTAAEVTFNGNLMPFDWSGPGSGNSKVDPLLTHVPTLKETQFDSWESAQVMFEWLRPLPGSPAAGRGPNGLDIGGAVPVGASIHGEPIGTNRLSTATLTVGSARTGNGIPPAFWPSGAGYTHYRWRLDEGAWSGETAIGAAIELSGLTPGPHQVEVSGRRDSGQYQDDGLLADAAVVTSSRTWVVDPDFVAAAGRSLEISEVLAKNLATLTSGELTPDVIELHNAGAVALDLGGVGVTDDPTRPHRYQFPSNTVLPPDGRLVLLGDSDTNSPGIHLGFSVKQSGDSVFLHAAGSAGGGLIDSVTFGPQVTDLSIGRVNGGLWALCRPTPGLPNEAVALGDARRLRINEWLASSQFLFGDDFVELFNPEVRPVALGGLLLTDAAGTVDRHAIPPLSYIGAGGQLAFVADGDAGAGGDHLNFKLVRDSGLIVLSDESGAQIDAITYVPQRTDVSQGRSPNGSDTLAYFTSPTPGGPNAGESGGGGVVVTRNARTVFDLSKSWHYRADAVNLGTAWHDTAFDDTSWKTGTALFGAEASTPYPYPFPIKTAFPVRTAGGTYVKTAYFRTHFTVADTAGYELWATNYLDDGAVFYINGTRVKALRVSDDPATYASDATNQPDEGATEVLQLPTGALVAGDNVLAVEVHQSGNSSTDIVFGMTLAEVTYTTNVIEQSSMPIRLNEVLVLNQTHLNPAGRASAWVELHNPSTNAVDLGSLSLTDDAATPRKWAFPAGASIGPEGYLTIAFDPGLLPSGTNTGFGLTAGGGAVFLFHRLEAGGVPIDSIDFGLQAADFSLGRVPDGTGNWVLAQPTEGTANRAVALGSPETLRLNEWMADPASGSDWFELFNGDAAPVAIGGLFLTDDLGEPLKSPIRPLSFIGVGSNAYAQIFADKKPASGANHADFKLGKSGSDLGIAAANGTVLDGLHFGAQGFNLSEGRLPDGSARIGPMTSGATPAAANTVGPADMDGDGLPDAWENQYGLDPKVRDASLDPDGDGLTNLEEFLAGTNPRDASSTVALAVAFGDGASVTLSFGGVAGHRYTIESRDDLESDSWTSRIEVPTRVTSGPVVLNDAAGAGIRFYRLLAR